MRLQRKYTEAEKMDLAKEFLASTDSMNKWCKERKLPHSTFRGWVKKYKAKQAPGDFVELVAPIFNCQTPE